jgi:hypothetical protein
LTYDVFLDIVRVLPRRQLNEGTARELPKQIDAQNIGLAIFEKETDHVSTEK